MVDSSWRQRIFLSTQQCYVQQTGGVRSIKTFVKTGCLYLWKFMVRWCFPHTSNNATVQHCKLLAIVTNQYCWIQLPFNTEALPKSLLLLLLYSGLVVYHEGLKLIQLWLWLVLCSGGAEINSTISSRAIVTPYFNHKFSARHKSKKVWTPAFCYNRAYLTSRHN